MILVRPLAMKQLGLVVASAALATVAAIVPHSAAASGGLRAGPASAVASYAQLSTGASSARQRWPKGPTPEPNPYVVWVEESTTTTSTPPAWEQCYGCDCMSAFAGRMVQNGGIAYNYTCFGGFSEAQVHVPDVSWVGPKDTTNCEDCQFFALTVDDLDYPNGIGAADNHMHNVFWAGNIPGDWTNLTAKTAGGVGEGLASIDELESNMVIVGRNSRGGVGMETLCPERGIHRYKTTVWALTSELTEVGPDASYGEVHTAIHSREMARVTFFAELKAQGQHVSRPARFLQH